MIIITTIFFVKLNVGVRAPHSGIQSGLIEDLCFTRCGLGCIKIVTMDFYDARYHAWMGSV